MEQKTPRLSAWRRVLRHRFYCIRLDCSGFNGYVTHFYIDKVSEPGVRRRGERTWCIADDGFLWLQCFPDGSHYSIRTIFNAQRTVEQWYIDICSPFSLDEQGIPTYIDWDLDVIVWPDGEVELWDADELEQSRKDGAITREDYDLAWVVANQLMVDLRAGRLILPHHESDIPRFVSI